MSTATKILIGVCGLCALLLVLLVRADGKLEAERARHDITRHRLEACISASHDWNARLQDSAGKILGLQRQTSECLTREKEAHKAAAERAAIAKKSKPRARTDAEKREVVDDTTREKTAGRLNRPL